MELQECRWQVCTNPIEWSLHLQVFVVYYWVMSEIEDGQ